jgi:hypothetical protein
VREDGEELLIPAAGGEDKTPELGATALGVTGALGDGEVPEEWTPAVEDPGGDMALVAGEELVAAIAGEGDAHVPAGGSGDPVSGQEGGIDEGEPDLGNELAEVIRGAWVAVERGVVGPQERGDALGGRGLVEAGVGHANGKGPERPEGLPGMQGHQRAVDAAGEEDAQGHVRVEA